MASREVRVAIIGDPSSLQRALRTSQTGLNTFQSRMEGFSSRMRTVGSSMTRGLTLPLVGFGIIAARELAAGENALAQTQAVIESTGGAAERSVQDILDLSQSLSELTSLDDEPIQEAANTLLTFKNVVGDTFDEATAATLDLSVAMDRDLRSSAVLVGRALNNPIKGLTALTRVGVDFSDQLGDTGYTIEETIRWMVQMGDVAGAQQLILAELNSEFGGSAEAFGTTTQGRLQRVKNQFEAMGATILENLLPAIEDLVGIVSGLSDAYSGLTPTQQSVVAWMILFAAVAGPLATTLGLVASAAGAVSGALTAVAAALGVSAGVVVVMIGLLAALAAGLAWIVVNWDQVKNAARNALQTIANYVPGGTRAVNALGQAIGAVRGALGTIAGAAQSAIQAIVKLGQMSLGGLLAAIEAVTRAISGAIGAAQSLANTLAGALGASRQVALQGQSAGGAIRESGAAFIPSTGPSVSGGVVSESAAREFARELRREPLPVVAL